MFSEVIVGFLLTVFAQDTTYYVTSNGRDSPTCGTEEIPCATVNQVIINYPGASFTVSIAAGTYKTDLIELQGNAFVVFQGTGNPIIVGSWGGTSFISNSDSSGFEFHDLTLSLFGDGDDDLSVFSSLKTNENTIGFYNVFLTYASNQYRYVYSDFIHTFSGSLTINNLTLSQAVLDCHFILEYGEEGETNITITESDFFNNTFLRDGGLIKFNHRGTAASVLFNSTTFDGNTAQGEFIVYIAQENNEIFVMSNCQFSNTHTSKTAVSVENAYFVQHDHELTIIQNTTWINVTADFDSGALAVKGSDSDDRYDCNFILNKLTFTNCVGYWAGALLVYCNSFNLSNSTFENNSAPGGYGNDVVQFLNDNTANFKFNITDSYSSSALPKAVIWNYSDSTVVDISDALPNSLPKFVRKVRK